MRLNSRPVNHVQEIMIIKHETISFAQQQIILTNQRAFFWESQQILVLSDLHLGKAAHFRKNGIALPAQLSIDDLSRLEALILHFNPGRVLIVGDLIHAGANSEVALFGRFTASFPEIDFLLVKGNHDRLTPELLSGLGIRAVYDELVIGALHFIHHPEQHRPGQYTISGHLHPGVAVRMPAKRIMHFPCYAVTEEQLILPAFAKFTGTDTRSVPRPANCYAFYEAGIFQVSHH
ncbi:MAG: ligase-associated DNA damage response endonuclease PdeM [Sphingobacteriales bacterium]|nr:MAG: ligase-associated DNA damage response endonuclease PdeM [Sphingobacteriales bacterium]